MFDAWLCFDLCPLNFLDFGLYIDSVDKASMQSAKLRKFNHPKNF